MATPPVFTSGSVLTAAQMNSVGLWLVNITTLTNDTSKQINDCFTADFQNYLIVGNLTTNTDATITYKLVDGTTPNAGNNTTMTGSYRNWANGNYNANSSGGAIANGFIAYCDATNGCGFTMEVFNPKNAVPTFTMSRFVDGDWNGDMWNRHAVSTAYEGIQISTQSGTAQLSGTIRVYGYRN